ncbi:MAG: KpsF/GutQ family sugar-phosphate isomerase [Elusimicrobiota bacterium]|jgi:arabinose-5-phosphate isomerase|nr:KpsF/GutQ family sugar-phosphate isomerase [Elusimicrobiota bacterium]
MNNQNKDLLSARKTIKTEIECLKALERTLDSSITKVLDLMQNTKGRIVFTGIGKSGAIAKKIVSSLSSTGTPSFFIHPAEAAHGDLGMLTKDDVIFAISNSGESKELIDILNYSKRFGISLVGITKNEESSLGKVCDVVLKIPDTTEACPLGLAPTSSTTATLVIGDILTVALMERKSFSKTDFNQRHPGGKLGSVLFKVSDLMHCDDAMPLLKERASIQTVILEMTSKRLGCVGLTSDDGKLSGIFTDGDLRRHLSASILTEEVKNLMTKNPKTTHPSVTAAEALKIMSENEITSLFAIENGIPVGIIHIHDCLKNKVG